MVKKYQEQSPAFRISVLLFIFSFLLYANSIPNEYNMDDELVADNDLIENRGIRAIPQLFSNAYYQDEMGYQYGYRPFTLATFAIEHAVFGDNPYLSHLVNVLLYSLLVVLIFISLCKLFPAFNWVFPALVAFLFAAHPIHTEAVASIKNREEILALLGGIGSLYCLTCIVKHEKWYYYILIPLFFFAGVLSKKSVISFAFITPLAGGLLLNLSMRQVLLLSVPLGTLAAFFVPVNLLIHKIGFAALVAIAPLLFLSTFWLQSVYWAKLLISFLQSTFRIYLIPSLKRMANRLVVFVNGLLKQMLQLYRNILHFFLHPTKTPAYSTKRNEQPGLIDAIMAVFTLSGFGIVLFLPDLIWFEFTLIMFAGLMALNRGAIKRHFWITIVLLLLAIFGFAYQLSFIFPLLIGSTAFLFHFSKHPVIRNTYLVLLIFYFTVVGFDNIVRGNSLALTALNLGSFFLFYGVLLGILEKFRGTRKGLIYITSFLTGLFIIGSAILILNKSGFVSVLFIFILSIIHLFLFGLAVLNKAYLLTRIVFLTITIYLITSIAFNYISFNENIQNARQSIIQQNETNNFTQEDGQPQKPLPPEQDLNPLNIGKVQSPSVFPKEGRKSLTYNENPIQHYENEPSVKFGISAYSLGYYLKLLLVPHPLNFYYGYAKIPVVSMSNGWALLSALVYLALGILSISIIRKYPVLAFGLLAFLSSIAVFSNFVAPAAGIIGERMAFTASLGFCIVIARLLVHIFKVDITRSQITFKDLPISFLIVTGLILALYSGKTFSRNFKWENRITLMQHDIENLENSSIANSLYAKNLMATLDQLTTAQRQQRIAKAEKHLKQSIDIYPAFFNNWYDLGRIQLMQKQYDQALKTFKRAIELDSTYPKTYMKIAGIYQKKGNRQKEFAYVKKAFDKQPTNERAGTYLGEFYMKQNQMEKAIDVLQKLVRNAPNSYQGRKKLGRAYFQSKRYKQAAQALEKAYQIRQNDYELVVNLSEIYRELGNKRKAEFYGKRARQLKGSQGKN
ncbi:MAG: hypothetical protein BRD50_08550 [Bacteroidetes bacterium SW_11_45_7]|nr:MAG: hypothetical protein BRD50_08550 [Bacteroidetes bacterium SW_11_45_7]